MSDMPERFVEDASRVRCAPMDKLPEHIELWWPLDHIQEAGGEYIRRDVAERAERQRDRLLAAAKAAVDPDNDGDGEFEAGQMLRHAIAECEGAPTGNETV